jgi:integrase
MPRKTNFETSNGNSYYRLRVDITKKMGFTQDGKRNIKVFYGDSRKEAEAKRDEYLKQFDSGIELSNEPLGELMNDWLFNVLKPSRKPSTIEKYEGILRIYIKNSPIGNIPINNIRTVYLQDYYNKLFNKMNKTENTIKEINKLLKAFFNYAIKESIILRNPCINISLPKSYTDIKPINHDLLVFTDDDISKLKNIEKPITTINIVKMALLTGMRCSELLALTVGDVNIQSKEIHITKAVRSVKVFTAPDEFIYDTVLQKPKTEASIRVIPFPDSLIPIILNQCEYEKAKYVEKGKIYNQKSLIFSTENCKYIDARSLSRSFTRLLRKAGIEYKTFHKLRHTYATKLFEQGVPLETVNALLGHNGDETITKIYVHITSSTKKLAAERLNNVFDF